MSGYFKIPLMQVVGTARLRARISRNADDEFKRRITRLSEDVVLYTCSVKPQSRKKSFASFALLIFLVSSGNTFRFSSSSLSVEMP